MSGRRTVDRVGRPDRPGRPPRARPGPLVAAPDPGRGRVRADEGPLRAFVRRYGWRAYAVPFLTLATLLVLVDVASDAPAGTPSTAVPSGEAASAAPPAPPVPDPGGGPEAPAQGDVDPGELPAPAAAEEATYVERGAGSVSVVDGSSRVFGEGPLQRFVVEVEDGLGVDADGFARAVEATLGDPRSWGHGGRMSFQRVGAAEAEARRYEFRVTLVSPGNMETYCPGVGTGGYTSCRYGERAVINLARWATAVPDYEGDIATYRHYVVNHEVGHALGQGHEPCPGPGRVAPVMQQQTLGLAGCTKNAWPYP